jgi:hypothetical protein
VTDYLLKAIISLAAILEDATKYGMDRDAAVNALEALSFELDQMGASDRREFAEALNRVADADPPMGDWIRSLPENLGIEL